MRTTVALVSHKLKLLNVEATLQLDEALPPLPCDASQMQQVVLNLVMNGAEATRPHGSGRVSVRTRRADDGESVVLEVEDDGEGIPKETLDRIFDPFFTTKDDGKGVGLGLAVVYGIVESHGGHIEVRTTAGRGTTFAVTLPLAPDANHAAEAPSVAGADAGAGSGLRDDRSDPLGDPSGACASAARRRSLGHGGGAREAFRLPVQRLAAIEEPARAFSPARGQWSSVAFLRRCSPRAARRVALPGGHGARPLRAGAQLRLRPGPARGEGGGRLPGAPSPRVPRPARGARGARPARRQEAVHEVGHTFGLVHCLDRRCPMSLSIDLPDLDGKTETPCAACRALLEGSREMRRTRATTEGGHP